MSAANASAPSLSSQEEARAHEPSIEEILASIRKIITDDAMMREKGDGLQERGHGASMREAYPAPALDRSAALDVSKLDDLSLETRRETAPERAPVADIRHFRAERRTAEPEMRRPLPPPPIAPVSVEPPVAASPAESAPAQLVEEPLVSADARASIASHFEALAASVVFNDSDLMKQYAQDMMRPMLKQWLDDNLPVIVERLVRAEIERVARGGRS